MARAARFSGAILVATSAAWFVSNWADQPASAQPPAFGPTATAVAPAAVAWPARPPARIYVVPFSMEPGLQERLAQQAKSSLIPQGPVRQMLAARPRVTDAVMGHDPSLPVGVSISRSVAQELAQAGLPAVVWDRPGPPPADGWALYGQVVGLDEGNAAARNAIGFGAGNKSIAIDVAMSDPATAGGRPFFILDSSDRGRATPGTLPIAAVAGFNPYVVVGKLVASNSGISDVAQQQRMADEIARAVVGAMNAHAVAPAR